MARVNDNTLDVFGRAGEFQPEDNPPYLETVFREGQTPLGDPVKAAIGIRIVSNPQEMLLAAMSGDAFLSIISNNVAELRDLRDAIDSAIVAIEAAQA